MSPAGSVELIPGRAIGGDCTRDVRPLDFGRTWATLEEVPEFAKATSLPTYTANTKVPLNGVLARYVKLTINANWGGIAQQTGLSEVRFFYIPVQAFEPQPEVGATGVGTVYIDDIGLGVPPP